METMNSTPCPFCEWYRKLKSIDEYYVGGQDGRSGKTEVQYGAALVHKLYYNGRYCGRSTYESEPLHYCPTCGIKLKKE